MEIYSYNEYKPLKDRINIIITKNHLSEMNLKMKIF